MDRRSSKGTNPRALAATTMLCAGLVTAMTGLWLSQTRQACQLRHVHLATALAWSLAACWHAGCNVKPLTSYLWTREHGGRLRLEARLALAVVTVAVLTGWLWSPARRG